MLINQQERDELELALSCTDHEYRLPVKHHHKKTDYTTSGFSREEAKEILIEFYRDNGYTDVHNFFKKHRTSHTEFRRVRIGLILISSVIIALMTVLSIGCSGSRSEKC